MLGILAIILGEISLVLCTTIVQEVLFSGVSYHSSLPILIFGGFFTFLASAISGLISRVIGNTYSIIIPSVISFFILTETTYLIFSGITSNPSWFDILAGNGLIIGIWIGYHYTEIKNSFFFKTYYPDQL